MKEIDIRKDTYTDTDSGITAPIGFGVLSERHRKEDALFFACDRIYNKDGEIIVPLDQQYGTIDEIIDRTGTKYYITDEEYTRELYSPTEKNVQH